MCKYVFRIYNTEYSYSNYDDNIFRVKESSVNPTDIQVEKYAENIERLEEIFNENLEVFEGATYCIKDLNNDTLIVGGVLDRNDIEIIKKK